MADAHTHWYFLRNLHRIAGKMEPYESAALQSSDNGVPLPSSKSSSTGEEHSRRGTCDFPSITRRRKAVAWRVIVYNLASNADGGYRTYIITTRQITSGDELK